MTDEAVRGGAAQVGVAGQPGAGRPGSVLSPHPAGRPLPSQLQDRRVEPVALLHQGEQAAVHFTVGEAGDVDIDDFVEPVAQPVDDLVHE